MLDGRRQFRLSHCQLNGCLFGRIPTWDGVRAFLSARQSRKGGVTCAAHVLAVQKRSTHRVGQGVVVCLDSGLGSLAEQIEQVLPCAQHKARALYIGLCHQRGFAHGLARPSPQTNLLSAWRGRR